MLLSTFIRRLVLLPALALYALVLGEACVRVLDPQPLMPRYVTGTPWGVRGNVPGAVYRHVTPEVDVGYRINRQGLRAEREYPEAPPAGACRIAVVGDSYLLGYEVEFDDTVARRLENELAAGGLPVEVLNFSVSGIGTAEMLRIYEGQIRRFSPDMLIVQWHYTDLEDNPRSGLYEVSAGELRRAARDYLPSLALQDSLNRSVVYRFLSEHSQLYSFLRERAGGLGKVAISWWRGAHSAASRPTGSSRPEPEVASIASAGERPVSAELLSAHLLRRLREQTSADDTDVLVVDVPDMLGRDKLVSVWSSLPADVLGDLPVLHAAEVLQPLASPSTKLYFERGHRHLTPLASSALGRAVAMRVKSALEAGRCGSRLKDHGS
jgi:hypothetical protein